jgi:hypothetical protein
MCACKSVLQVSILIHESTLRNLANVLLLLQELVSRNRKSLPTNHEPDRARLQHCLSALPEHSLTHFCFLLFPFTEKLLYVIAGFHVRPGLQAIQRQGHKLRRLLLYSYSATREPGMHGLQKDVNQLG